MREYLGISSPQLTLESHHQVLMSIKEAVEVLTRQRGNKDDSAAMLKEVTPKLEDAPHDGQLYGRRNGVWEVIPP